MDIADFCYLPSPAFLYGWWFCLCFPENVVIALVRSATQCYFLWMCVPRAHPHLLSGALLFCTCGWLFHVSGWLFCCQCFVHKKYFYFPCLAMSLAVWVLGNDGFLLWVRKESLCFYLLKELWKIGVISSLNFWENSPWVWVLSVLQGLLIIDSTDLINKGSTFFHAWISLGCVLQGIGLFLLGHQITRHRLVHAFIHPFFPLCSAGDWIQQGLAHPNGVLCLWVIILVLYYPLNVHRIRIDVYSLISDISNLCPKLPPERFINFLISSTRPGFCAVVLLGTGLWYPTSLISALIWISSAIFGRRKLLIFVLPYNICIECMHGSIVAYNFINCIFSLLEI